MLTAAVMGTTAGAAGAANGAVRGARDSNSIKNVPPPCFRRGKAATASCWRLAHDCYAMQEKSRARKTQYNKSHATIYLTGGHTMPAVAGASHGQEGGARECAMFQQKNVPLIFKGTLKATSRRSRYFAVVIPLVMACQLDKTMWSAFRRLRA